MYNDFMFIRNMALTMSSKALDSALMVVDNDQWCVGGLEDTCRLSVPLEAPDYIEHYALGLDVSYNSTLPIPISE